MRNQEQILIVYSTKSNVFYEMLARRLATACEESSWEARLCTSTEISDLDADQLEEATLALINPVDCAYKIGDAAKYFSRLSSARRRIMVLAEAVETRWFENQLRLPVSYDAFIDVGFVSQEHKVGSLDMPYHFLFNGPTAQEERKTAQLEDSSGRPIAWATVGHQTRGRVELAAQLARQLHPGGFVFLPNPGRGVRARVGAIGPRGLSAMLEKTRCYVWESHHQYDYFESFRFLEAITAGCLPCKVDPQATVYPSEIPGIVASISELSDHLEEKGVQAMRRSAQQFYLSSGRLAHHLQDVLTSV